MECSINNQQDDFPITEGIISLLAEALEIAAELENVDPAAEVSLTLVDEATIQEFNRNYRGIDAPTDVLAFALEGTSPEEPVYVDPSGNKLLGDIIVSVPTAISQAGAYEHSPERELAFLAVHGFLHLLGYDHASKSAAGKMEERQKAILSRLGLKR